MHVKPGYQTTEFWLVVAALVVTAAHTLGLRIGDGPASAIVHGFSASGLSLITAWLGGNYMSIRAQVKANPTAAGQLLDHFTDRLRSCASDVESGVLARITSAAEGFLQVTPAAPAAGQANTVQDAPQNPAAPAAAASKPPAAETASA